MDKMDLNGDGMLQEEEFTMFLGAAIMRERLSDGGDNDKEDETRDAEETEDDKEEQRKLKGVLSIIDCELPMLN